MGDSSGGIFFRCELQNEDATNLLAADIAAAVMPGDVILLNGDLGAGKTTFCRALIRALAGNELLEVPSPTFSLMQPYDCRLPIRHFDLYRLSSADELEEIGFFDDLEESLTLIEWPDRAASLVPENHLSIFIEVTQTDQRLMVFQAPSAISARFKRSFDARNFIESSGYSSAVRQHVQGDASHRSYERLCANGKPTAIFMNAPKTPPGEIVSDGKSYAELVHRALDTRPFEAVDVMLNSAGLGVPKIFAADHEIGFMLLEDLGSEGLIDDQGALIRERYLAAVDALAALHDQAVDLKQTITGPDGPYVIPDFDRTAFLTEAGLFVDWYVPHKGVALAAGERDAFLNIWSDLYASLKNAETGPVLRDVHSPNLMWLDQRAAPHNVGFLDFQDALWGPQIYDIASLIFDARIAISVDFRKELFQQYCNERKSEIDTNLTEQHLTVLAGQRTVKILGIFARLANKDAKLSYLAHIPRNEIYLDELLAAPVLAPFADWYNRILGSHQSD